MIDLSNARIIEWDSDGWPSVGARAERGDIFVTTNGRHDTLTEAEAFGLGARVVAEFPVRSLAEVVGDAPAFLYDRKKAGRAIAVRLTRDGWAWINHFAGPGKPLDEVPVGDVASVVPLWPEGRGQ